MKTIPLTKGYEAQVSDEDFDRVSKFKWSASVGRNTVYAIRNAPGPNRTRKFVKLHRFVVDAPDELVVDHIDGNGLNCTRENLRLCTQAENVRNLSPNRRNKSGYKGVFWNTQKNKWQAKISINSKDIHLGFFDDPEIAAQAYQNGAQKHHGEFAKSSTQGAQA